MSQKDGKDLIVQTSARMKRIVPMPNKYMKESLILKYDNRIRALILSLVTLSVFGDIARLMPTEKMTPATVYSVPSTSPGTSSEVNSEMAQEIAIENRRYAKIFFIVTLPPKCNENEAYYTLFSGAAQGILIKFLILLFLALSREGRT